MPEMFFCVLAVYNNVFDIYQRKVSQMADENPLAHVALKGPGGILQAKRHNVPFVETSVRCRGVNNWSESLIYLDLPEPRLHAKNIVVSPRSRMVSVITGIVVGSLIVILLILR